MNTLKQSGVYLQNLYSIYCSNIMQCVSCNIIVNVTEGGGGPGDSRWEDEGFILSAEMKEWYPEKEIIRSKLKLPLQL